MLRCTSIIILLLEQHSAIKACHHGPGVFNDFEFLFDPVARSRCTTSLLCAYEDWKFIRKHTQQDFQRRQDGRGRPPISTNLVMATALLFLGHGTTYLTTSIMIRNGLSETSTLRCVRLFAASAVVKRPLRSRRAGICARGLGACLGTRRTLPSRRGSPGWLRGRRGSSGRRTDNGAGAAGLGHIA